MHESSPLIDFRGYELQVFMKIGFERHEYMTLPLGQSTRKN